MRAVHADTDCDGRDIANGLSLDQDAGELRPVEQQIVRPFEFELLVQWRCDFARRIPHRERHHETKLRQMRRRCRIGQ